MQNASYPLKHDLAESFQSHHGLKFVTINLRENSAWALFARTFLCSCFQNSLVLDLLECLKLGLMHLKLLLDLSRSIEELCRHVVDLALDVKLVAFDLDN